MAYSLIYIVILSLVWEFFSVLLKPIIAFFSKENSSNRELKREILSKNAELSEISMIDDFAKYAKLQRKVNALKTQLDNKISEQLQDTMKFKLFITSSARIILGVANFIFVWQYKYEPVTVLPEAWLSPLSAVISFPTAVSGAVGLPIWFIASKAFAKSILSVTQSVNKKS